MRVAETADDFEYQFNLAQRESANACGDDTMYIEKYSFLLDVKLVLMTVRILFKKESTEGFDKVVSADDILAELENTDRD